MSTRSLTLSLVLGFSALAFGRDALSEPAAPNTAVRNAGRLDIAVDAASGEARGSLTIVGMDHPHRTRVALSDAAASGALELPLPAGLYSVEWTLDPTSFDAAEPPAPSSPRLVVVSAGGVSTVALRAARAAL